MLPEVTEDIENSPDIQFIEEKDLIIKKTLFPLVSTDKGIKVFWELGRNYNWVGFGREEFFWAAYGYVRVAMEENGLEIIDERPFRGEILAKIFISWSQIENILTDEVARLNTDGCLERCLKKDLIKERLRVVKSLFKGLPSGLDLEKAARELNEEDKDLVVHLIAVSCNK